MYLRKLSIIIFPTIIVILVVTVLYFFRQGDSAGRPFVVSNTYRRGVSLFFDTLQHMGYPVEVSHRPLTIDTDTAHVYIIIQPAFPPSDYERAEMLEWVRSGGRLIFIQTRRPLNIMAFGSQLGNIWIYEYGEGMAIISHPDHINNLTLMHHADTGTHLHRIITQWNADRIIFAEYYHTAPVGDNLFSRLPLIVRLVFIQLGIAALITIWHFGKRFGNPVPYYAETERQENEHVHAVTRPYLKTRRK